MYNSLKSIRRERASLERDRVVISSMLEDARIADTLAEHDGAFLESTDDAEIEALIARLPESDSEDDEIERVLKADNDLDIDGILDIVDDYVDND